MAMMSLSQSSAEDAQRVGLYSLYVGLLTCALAFLPYLVALWPTHWPQGPPFGLKIHPLTFTNYWLASRSTHWPSQPTGGASDPLVALKAPMLSFFSLSDPFLGLHDSGIGFMIHLLDLTTYYNYYYFYITIILYYITILFLLRNAFVGLRGPPVGLPSPPSHFPSQYLRQSHVLHALHSNFQPWTSTQSPHRPPQPSLGADMQLSSPKSLLL